MKLEEEKENIITTLCSTDNRSRISMVLNFALSSAVKSLEAVRLLIKLSSQPNGRDMAWRHFKDNFQQYKEKIGDNVAQFMKIFKVCSHIHVFYIQFK